MGKIFGGAMLIAPVSISLDQMELKQTTAQTQLNNMRAKQNHLSIMLSCHVAQYGLDSCSSCLPVAKTRRRRFPSHGAQDVSLIKVTEKSRTRKLN